MLSCFSHVRLFVTLWTVARQAPLSMGFSRQEYWSGLPCPRPGDLPDPGTESTSLMSPTLAGGFFITSSTWRALLSNLYEMNGLETWSVLFTSRGGENAFTSVVSNPLERAVLL